MKGLSVLSFGSTRGLWDGAGAEDFQRMLGYAGELDEYVIVAHSYKRHGLTRLRLAPHAEAIPTNGFCALDSALRMFAVGFSTLGRRRISLIQAQDPLFSGPLALLLGKLFRLPVNVCVYGPNVFDAHWLASRLSHRLLAPVGRWVLRRCDGIQVDGQFTARSLGAAGLPASRIAVKPMVPANLDRFFEIPRRESATGAPVRLLFVGRLAGQKNLRLLLRVVKTLRARCAQAFTLTLVGEGSEERNLRRQAEREGLSDIVHFRGALPRERIADTFAEAEIFVLTSDFEGYPRVLMEAAAAALPSVATAVSGADEAIVNGETGWIVPVGDADAVAEKLALLIESTSLRHGMGLAARRHIRARLDPRTNTPAQLRIWKSLAAPAPALPRRLLLFNLVTDAQHPILGFTTQWIRELATRVESIDVVTMQAGVVSVPANVRVHSVGKERGFSEPRRVLEFYRHLFRILRERRIDGCFSHMIQIFSVLAAPVLRAKGIPLVTWYAHPSLTPSLKLAHALSHRMVTSLPAAYPHRPDKVSVIGQGIDTHLFAPVERCAPRNDAVLCVGRISRVKDHPTLLRAAAVLRTKPQIIILGATAGADDAAYLAELRRFVAELGLEDRVTFAPPVPPGQLPAQYARCAVHVNLTPAGFGDKVALEAMSSARPCLVANTDFRETLGPHAEALLFQAGDAADLARKIDALLAKTPAQRDELGRALRARVEQLHSLPRLAGRILEEIARCRAGRARREAPHPSRVAERPLAPLGTSLS